MKNIFYLFILGSLITIVGCTKEMISENEEKIQSNLRTSSNLLDNVPAKNLAYQLAISDNSIINPDDEEYLLAKSLLGSTPTTNSHIIQAVQSNPIITIAFPSLDDFPVEQLSVHKDNIDYWVYLPQDLSNDTLYAYDGTGNEVNLIQSSLDHTKRYCVIKHSEQYYAFSGIGTRSFIGAEKPDSLNLFSSKFTVNNYNYYDFNQYYNALAVGEGTPRSVIEGDGGILTSGPDTGPGPRGICDCNESDYERDCEPGMDQLGKFRFTDYDDTYKVESFWHGPSIEMRNVFVYYNHNNASLGYLNTGIIKRRHKMSIWCNVKKDLLNNWDRSVNGDRTLSQWLEEKKGNGVKLKLSLAPTIKVGEVEIDISKLEIEVNTSDADYNLGNMHVWFEDPYYSHKEYSPVWVGPKGVFKFTQVRK